MVFRGQERFWIVDMTLETKIEVNKIILCGLPPAQLIDQTAVMFSIIDCASFFVSSCLAHLM